MSDFLVTHSTIDIFSVVVDSDDEFDDPEIEYEFSNGRKFEAPENPYA